MSSGTATPFPPGTATADATWPPRTLVPLAAAVLVASADWFFWDRAAGVSLALFGLLILLAVTTLTPPATIGARHLAATGAALAGFLAVTEYVQALSIMFFAFGLVAFALVVDGWLAGKLRQNPHLFVLFPGIGVGRFGHDLAAAARYLAARSGARGERLIAWIMPLGVGLVFLALFDAANPVVDDWLARALDIELPDDLARRLLFWNAIALLVWPFLRLGACAWPIGWFDGGGRHSCALGIARRAHPLVGPDAVRNALVLCNALFAVETLLDITYLWGGATLPDGMTYAEYAHRGAYPLLATALLAGALVILVTSFARHDRLVRWLILAWIAQNILLLGSAILRLNLYVSVYSLTYLRVAAFIWMGLVAGGFLLIVLRLTLGRGNGWLVRWNLALAGAVLYACCFVNFAPLIARYNTEHSSLVTAGARPLDQGYLCRLGPHALPAVLAHRKVASGLRCGHRPMLDFLAFERPRSWGAWTLRDWRLARYLERDEALQQVREYEPARRTRDRRNMW